METAQRAQRAIQSARVVEEIVVEGREEVIAELRRVSMSREICARLEIAEQRAERLRSERRKLSGSKGVENRVRPGCT